MRGWGGGGVRALGFRGLGLRVFKMQFQGSAPVRGLHSGEFAYYRLAPKTSSTQLAHSEGFRNDSEPPSLRVLGA